MADGSQKPISDVRIGDDVVATDPEAGVTKAEPVINLIRHSGTHTMATVRLSDGSEIEATDHHPFYDATTGKWTDAISLPVGHLVRTAEGNFLTITAVLVHVQDVVAYNLTIDEVHTYFVGPRVLVHNASCSPNPWGKRGSPEHVARVDKAEQNATRLGWKVEAGGSMPERKFGNRFPDLVVAKGNKRVAIQVGRMTKSGRPVARERRALDDLRKSGSFDKVIFVKYTPVKRTVAQRVASAKKVLTRKRK